MKRNLVLVILACLMLCCTAFAACNTGVHTHTIEKVESVAATCETAGNSEHYRCTDCNKLFADELATTEIAPESVVITALGHDEESHDAKAATCTEDGWNAYVTCKREGCDYTTKVVIPAAHTEVIDEAVAPTCTEAGLTEGKHCSVCNEVIVAQQTVKALGHTEVKDDAVAATCTKTGLTEGKHCSVCNEVIVAQQEVTALGHDNKGTIAHKDATCTEAGVVGGTYCTRCNDGKAAAEATIEALGHDEESHDGQAATCTEDGWDAYVTCSRCDYTTYKKIDALGHTEVKDNAKAPTCSETGLTEGKHCSVCNEVIVAQQEVTALGHDNKGTIAHKDATCTEAGVEGGTYCTRCNDGKSTAEATISALGHDNKGTIEHKDATCTEAGVEGGTYCTRCDDGKAAAEATISALGHKNKVHHEKVEATCTEAGMIEYWSCPDCKKNFSDEACTKVVTDLEIEALGHDEVNHGGQAATCTKDGWNAYVTCSRCDYSTYKKIDALGHDTISHDAKAATCTEKGWEAYETCSRCDYTTYAEIPALGYQARLDKTITSSKSNTAVFIGNSYGTKTSGSVYGDGKVGGLSYNATLSYTFSLKTEGTVDFIWKIAANNYSADGNRGVADLGKVANITIDGVTVHVEGIALTVNPSNAKDYWYSFDLAIENVELSKGEHVFSLALSGPGLNVTSMTIASDTTVFGVYPYQAVVDNDFVSLKANGYTFTYDSNGTSTNGGKANGTGIGSLDNSTKYLSYTFVLAADDTVDFVWKVAGAKWNGNAGGTGVAGNLGVDDLSKVASITLDGKTVGVDKIALKPDTYTNYWYTYTLVVDGVTLEAGEHTFAVNVLQAGINVQSMTIYSDKVISGHETAKAIIDGSFVSENANVATFVSQSVGVETSGTKYDNGKIGGLTYNATLSYTFSLSETSDVDLIWKVAGNAYNGNAGGTGVAGNLGVADLGKVATVTIDGKKIDVAGIALTTDTYTNYWYIHTVVIKDLNLSEGTHTFAITLSGPGLNVESLDICSNTTVAGAAA